MREIDHVGWWRVGLLAGLAVWLLAGGWCWWLVAGGLVGWWLVAGAWWLVLVAVGWWLVAVFFWAPPVAVGWWRWLVLFGCWLFGGACWLVAGGCWLLAVGWWLLAGGWWLVAVRPDEGVFYDGPSGRPVLFESMLYPGDAGIAAEAACSGPTATANATAKSQKPKANRQTAKTL